MRILVMKSIASNKIQVHHYITPTISKIVHKLGCDQVFNLQVLKLSRTIPSLVYLEI